MSKSEIMKSFDWVGVILIAAAPTLMLIGIIWVTTYGARSAHFLAPFLLGCVLMIVLGLHQAYIAHTPLLHPTLFGRLRTFTSTLMVALVGGMLFYSLEDFLPTYLQVVYDGNDSIKIGVDSMPFGAGTNIGGVGAAVLLPVLGKRIGTNWMVTIGVLLQVIFIPLMSYPSITNKGAALAFSLLGGIGIGIVELLTLLLIQYSTPDEFIGFASGSLGLFRTLGGSFGTAIYTTIFTNKATSLVPVRVATAAVMAGLPESSVPQLLGILTGSVNMPITSVPGISLPIIEASTVALKIAYRSAFQYVWWTSIPFGILALGCALVTKDLSSQLTMQVVQHIKTEVPHNHIDTEEAREHESTS